MSLRFALRNMVLLGAACAGVMAQETNRLDAIVNDANLKRMVATASRTRAYGRFNIPENPARCTATPNEAYPTSLCGVTVRVNGELAPLGSVARDVITFVMPDQSGEASIVVGLGDETTNAMSTTILPAAPAIYRQDGLAAIVKHDDNKALTRTSPLRPYTDDGKIASIFLGGMGRSDDLRTEGVTVGTPVPAERVYHAPMPDEVSIDGQAAEVLNASMAPGYTGLWQLDVRLPEGLRTGAKTLKVCLWRECDTADILVLDHDTPYVTLRVTPSTNGRNTPAPAPVATITNPRTGLVTTTTATENGNIIARAEDKEPLEIVVGAGPEYDEYRDNANGTIPPFVLSQHKNYPNSLFTYEQDRIDPACDTLQVGGQGPCEKWVPGGTPMNLADFVKYEQSAFYDGVLGGIMDRRWASLPIPIAPNLDQAPAGKTYVKYGEPDIPMADGIRRVIENFKILGQPAFVIVDKIEDRGIDIKYNTYGNFSSVNDLDTNDKPVRGFINIHSGDARGVASTVAHELYHALGAGLHDPDENSILYYATKQSNWVPFDTTVPPKLQDLLDAMYEQPWAPGTVTKDSVFLKLYPPTAASGSESTRP